MPQSSNRDEMLARIRLNVRAGNVHREARHQELAPDVGYFGAGPDPVTRLIAELTAVGSRPQRLGSAPAVCDATLAACQASGARRVLVNADPVIEELGICERLSEAGIEVWRSDELATLSDSERRERLFAADVGVAAPDWAIAETGSLAYAARRPQMRSTSLLPPVHVAIVDARRILPDVFDLSAQLQQASATGELPANVVLVTGPSKTGDIELRLTTGVHGPGELYVLVWERGG